jgi:hypothetical protein
MRPSYEALPTWLSRLPTMAPTPVRPRQPPEEGVLRRALGNPRLPLHVVIFAVCLGVGAAVAVRAVRVEHHAESRAQMSAFAERKIAELRAFGTLRSGSIARAPLAAGGSLVADVPGFFDAVEGTDGRRFQRRWKVDSAPTGSRRIVVRMLPVSREAGEAHLDTTAIIPPR